MSMTSGLPAALDSARALEPTPRAGPEYSHSESMWLVNGSWLAMTSRRSKTSSRGVGTSMETRTGRMYHMVHFSSVKGKDTRQRLLDGAIAYVTENGLGDLSLRSLATALGTSHRMLIH